MHRYLSSLILFLLIVSTPIFAKYELKVGKRSKSQIDRLPFKSVADMKNIPQDTAYYAKQLKPMSWSKQKSYDKQYNKRFFAPWKMSQMNEPIADMTWQVRFVKKRKIYDGRKKLISQKAWQWWIDNSNLENIDTVQKRAITITHSNLRAFPTSTPAYRDPWKTTEGFPFDYNQNSEL
ncbi:MAG TPA: glycoside hydrolase, partial [Sulfurovum sp.]|nr:glycoside hydrolase [Sulfurovum sp.]